MTGLAQDSALQMFFDEDFSPVKYVDALFLMITGTSDRYSTQNISKLTSTTQDLLTHLDYGTKMLLRELETKMDQLKKLSSAVGVSEYAWGDGNSGPENAETSRLQYYVDSLTNAVETLSADVETVRGKTHTHPVPERADEAGNGDPIGSLIQLKEVKARILQVYHVIHNAETKVGGGAELGISDESFQAALLLLHEKVRAKLKEGTEEDRVHISEAVKELRSWVPMFLPFTRFGPVFVKFVVKMENEL